MRELRELSRPSQIPRDKVQQRFAEHTLQIAIQAILDVASHIVSDERRLDDLLQFATVIRARLT